jgi:hypothetical protein
MTSHSQPDGTPPGWQEAFLAQLRETGNVSAAARAAGNCRSRCYEWRLRDRVFAAAWADALEEAADRLSGRTGFTARYEDDDGTVRQSRVTARWRDDAVWMELPAGTPPPQQGAPVALCREGADSLAETWRVISVREVADAVVEIAAIHHDPAKYDRIDRGEAIAAAPQAVSGVDFLAPPPTSRRCCGRVGPSCCGRRRNAPRRPERWQAARYRHHP